MPGEHHYVPQFYLRNFSLDERTIGLVLIPKIFRHNTASIKGQCKKHNFHGTDDKLEKDLCDFEDKLAPIFAAIIKNRSLPDAADERLLKILEFLIVQRSRTVVAAEAHAAASNFFLNLLNGHPNMNSSLMMRPKKGGDAVISDFIATVRFAQPFQKVNISPGNIPGCQRFVEISEKHPGSLQKPIVLRRCKNYLLSVTVYNFWRNHKISPLRRL